MAFNVREIYQRRHVSWISYNIHASTCIIFDGLFRGRAPPLRRSRKLLTEKNWQIYIYVYIRRLGIETQKNKQQENRKETLENT